MQISNRHERIVAATPERVAAIVADFDSLWPTQFAPAPRAKAPGVYDTGQMVWEEFNRPDAICAFRVISPSGFQVEHWFELEQVEGGTLLRHTLEGLALGNYEATWSERIEPFHNRVLEAVLDNVEAAVAATG